MDEADRLILEELTKDAKTSLKMLSRRLQMPLSTVYQRIKKMEQEKLITNYTVNVDWKKLGLSVKAYISVFVDTTRLKEMRKPQKEILEDLRRLPFVYDVEMVTGDADLIMIIRARDTHDLGRLLTEKVQSIPGITNTKSLVSISY
ncbi:MAG TPA: Lrp/AsnC family transcriptional regulator [Candidatus Bilamarchaeum sp.]|nr:Lrp/AsnC family transcriptional regulator [Candidatus Bilamarchaeum sp.]